MKIFQKFIIFLVSIAPFTSFSQNIVSGEYWFDADYANKQTIGTFSTPDLNTGIINLNATTLTTGQHTLNYRFVDNNGKWSSCVSTLFNKDTDKRIIGFRYWLNTDFVNVIDSTLASPITDLQLNTIVLVGNVSSITNPDTINFQFKNADGKWSSVISDTFSVGTTCISWQSSPPTSPNILTATNYLCTNSIIQNTQDAIVNQGAIQRHDLAKIVYKGLLGTGNVITPADSFTSTFYDLQNPSNYYYKFVKALTYLEYGDGVSPFSRDFAHFRPSENILRKDAMKVLAEAWNLPRDFTAPSPFTDVAITDKSYGWIKAMYNAGLIAGGTFSPDVNITRDSCFIILHKMLTTLTKPIPTNADYYRPFNLTPENMSRIPSLDEGNFSNYSKTSFNINGLMPLNFTHSYNASSLELPNEYTYRKKLIQGVVYDQYPIGEGWSHTYNTYILPIFGDSASVSTDDRILVHWGDGTNELYKIPAVSGQLYIPEAPSNYNELVVTGGQFVLTTKNQMKYTFALGGGNTNIAPLIKMADRNNNELNLNYTYNGLVPKLNTVTDPSGRALNFSYTNIIYPNRVTNIAAITGSITRNVSFAYNLEGQLISYTDPKGQVTQYIYDTTQGQTDLLAKIILPKGNYINNTYANRKLTSSKTNNTYQTINAPVTNYDNGKATTSANTSVTRNGQTLNYNTFRNTLGLVDSMKGLGLDFKTEFTDILNKKLPTLIKNNLTNITVVPTYDAKGNLLSMNKSDGTTNITQTYTYNTTNDILSATDANGNTTNYTYTNGILSSLIQPIGTTNYINNTNGTVASITNPNGIITTYSYNTYGNITSTNLGSITNQYVYDDASRLVSTTNPMNVNSNYTYDNNDNRTGDYFDATGLAINTLYGFDANDNITSITNALGGITSMTYDNQDELIQQTFGGNSKHYEYNEDGTLKKFTSQNGVDFVNSYNTDGSLISDGYATTTYNSDKTVATITKGNRTLTYGYDNFKRINSMSYNDFPNNTVTYQYDNNGNITQINYPNNVFITKYIYDANNRLTQVKDGNTNTALATYTYFADGRLQRQDNANGTYTTYTYDAIGRMTGLGNYNSSNAVIAEYTFTLDNNDNHTLETSNIPNGLAMPTITNMMTSGTYTNNHINTYAGASYTSDANGNILNNNIGVSYTWDSKDNLLTYTNNGTTFTYGYDPLENRRRRNNSLFVLDPLNNTNVLMETDTTGNPINIYVHGLGLVCRLTPNLVNSSFYHYDFRGSTIAITNDAQAITHKYLYGAFGEKLADSNATTFNNPFRYVGQYGVMYEDSLLSFMRARYYNPELGRFLGEDPIWGTNLFPYCDNNPISNIDPDANLKNNKILNTRLWLQEKSLVTGLGLLYNTNALYSKLREIRKSGKEDFELEQLNFMPLQFTNSDKLIGLTDKLYFWQNGGDTKTVSAATKVNTIFAYIDIIYFLSINKKTFGIDNDNYEKNISQMIESLVKAINTK